MSTAQSRNIRLLGQTDLGGMGDGMHINVKDGYAYFGHQGNGGTSIVDVRDPRSPTPVGNIPAPPNTHSHKVQVLGDLLLVNRERQQLKTGGSMDREWMGGIAVYDISDPVEPRPVSYWACAARGVHRMTFWSEPYVYATAGSSQCDNQILIIVDLSDPSAPVEAGRWCFPGMRRDEAHLRQWDDDRHVKFHHGIPRGDRLYGGWWDLGMAILDIADPSAPELVSHLDLNSVDGPSKNTHTVSPVPGLDAVVVTDECNRDNCEGIEFRARIVDISDEKNPRVLSRFPVPEGDFCSRGGRFGPHNIHEPRPDSYQGADLVFMTYFNAGVRVFDISDLSDPEEVAYFVPEAPPGQPCVQMNDVYVGSDGLVYASDRHAGGLYIFELDALA